MAAVVTVAPISDKENPNLVFIKGKTQVEVYALDENQAKEWSGQAKRNLRWSGGDYSKFDIRSLVRGGFTYSHIGYEEMTPEQIKKLTKNLVKATT